MKTLAWLAVLTLLLLPFASAVSYVSLNSSRISPTPTASSSDTLKGYCNASTTNSNNVSYVARWYLNDALNKTSYTSAFERVTNLTVQKYFTSAVIDQPNGYAYFGVYNNPGKITKVNLSNFQEVSTITLGGANEIKLASAVIDTANGYAYFGSDASTGVVSKINLTTFADDAHIQLNSGEDHLISAAIDTTNGYAYFGTDNYPAKIVKVNLSDFTRVDKVTLNSAGDDAEGALGSAVIDTQNGYAYFGGTVGHYIDPDYFPRDALIVQINLSDFSRVTNITIPSASGSFASAVIDEENGYAYFGGVNVTSGLIVRLDLSDLSWTNITPSSNFGTFTSAAIDTENGYAYFGTDDSPGQVVRVNLSDLSWTNITLDSSNNENDLTSAVIDQPNGYAYFGTNSATGKIVKVNLRDHSVSNVEVNVANISSDDLAGGQNWTLECQASADAGVPDYLNSSETTINTCSWASGDWVVSGTDACNISTNYNLLGNDLLCSGSGLFTVLANITNVSIVLAEDGCNIRVQNGNRISKQ